LKGKYQNGVLNNLDKYTKMQFLELIRNLKECPHLDRCRNCRIGVIDRDGRLVAINKRIEELYGNIAGKFAKDYLVGEDIQIAQAARDKLDQGSVENLFVRIIEMPFGEQWVNLFYTKRCPGTGWVIFRSCPLPGARNIFTIIDKNKPSPIKNLQRI